MTNKRIEEIKNRLSKATKGKWYLDKDGEVICGRKSDPERISEGLLPQLIETGFIERNDAEFIAHSKSDIEFLLEEIDRLKKALLECAMQGVDMGVDGGPYKSDFVRIAREALK